MTAKQIAKALVNAGISTDKMEIRSNEVEIWTGNVASTERLTNKVIKALGWGGYRTGYGAWVLQTKTTDMGEYGDKSSRWHY